MFRVCLLSVLLFTSIAAAQLPVPEGAKVEKVVSGFQFVEGPLWMNGELLFSDIDAGKIYQWKPGASTASAFMNPSHFSNGLALDNEGHLVFCQMGYRRVVRMDSDGTVTPLASTYMGKEFNCPNDLVVKSDGAIYFTDPDYNIPLGQKRELSFNGVYRISPAGSLTLLDSTLHEPNGICFSPGEKYLYVDDVYRGEGYIYRWDMIGDSVANKRVFASMAVGSGVPDGMKTDSAGNIFMAGPKGIWVFSPSGTILDTIRVDETPSNCNWGNADGKTLYITARTSVYRINLTSTTGIGSIVPNAARSFQLYSNFPNPFNPTTRISYKLPSESFVTLSVYDVLGRELETLVNARQSAGVHSITFDGSHYPSGLFFCRMSGVGEDGRTFGSVDKMVMVK